MFGLTVWGIGIVCNVLSNDLRKILDLRCFSDTCWLLNFGSHDTIWGGSAGGIKLLNLISALVSFMEWTASINLKETRSSTFSCWEQNQCRYSEPLQEEHGYGKTRLEHTRQVAADCGMAVLGLRTQWSSLFKQGITTSMLPEKGGGREEESAKVNLSILSQCNANRRLLLYVQHDEWWTYKVPQLHWHDREMTDAQRCDVRSSLWRSKFAKEVHVEVWSLMFCGSWQVLPLQLLGIPLGQLCQAPDNIRSNTCSALCIVVHHFAASFTDSFLKCTRIQRTCLSSSVSTQSAVKDGATTASFFLWQIMIDHYNFVWQKSLTSYVIMILNSPSLVS